MYQEYSFDHELDTPGISQEQWQPPTGKTINFALDNDSQAGAMLTRKGRKNHPSHTGTFQNSSTSFRVQYSIWSSWSGNRSPTYTPNTVECPRSGISGFRAPPVTSRPTRLARRHKMRSFSFNSARYAAMQQESCLQESLVMPGQKYRAKGGSTEPVCVDQE